MKNLSRVLVVVLVLAMIIPSISAYSYYSKPVPVYVPNYYAPSYGPSTTFYSTSPSYTFVISQPSFGAVLPGVTYQESKYSAANYMKNVQKMEKEQHTYPSLLKQYQKEEREIAGHYSKELEAATTVVGLLGFFV